MAFQAAFRQAVADGQGIAEALDAAQGAAEQVVDEFALRGGVVSKAMRERIQQLPSI